MNGLDAGVSVEDLIPNEVPAFVDEETEARARKKLGKTQFLASSGIDRSRRLGGHGRLM